LQNLVDAYESTWGDLDTWLEELAKAVDLAKIYLDK